MPSDPEEIQDASVDRKESLRLSALGVRPISALLNSRPHRLRTSVSGALEGIGGEVRVGFRRASGAMADVLASDLESHTPGDVPADDVVSEIV